MAKYDFTNETPFNEQPLYKQGYEDAIDKACEYLRNTKSWDYYGGEDYYIMCEEGIEDFRKYMEE